MSHAPIWCDIWYRMPEGVIMSITDSEARKRLFPLIAEVNDDQIAVEN